MRMICQKLHKVVKISLAALDLPSSPLSCLSSSASLKLKTGTALLLLQVGLHVGELRGSSPPPIDMYRVSHSLRPRELVRSISGTNRSMSSPLSITSPMPSMDTSPISMNGSPSAAPSSALEHRRTSESPKIAVLVGSACWGEEGTCSGEALGAWICSSWAWVCSSLSSVSSQWGLWAERMSSSRSFSFNRLAISDCRTALTSSRLSVSYTHADYNHIMCKVIFFEEGDCNILCFVNLQLGGCWLALVCDFDTWRLRVCSFLF